MAFFPLRRVRALAALYWSMLETYQRCLYSNLWCFGVGFPPFSPVLSLPKQKQIPLAYFPAWSGIAWAVLYPCLRHIKQACSGTCGILVSSFLQSVQSWGCLEKTRNFFGPLANTESKSLDSALLRFHSNITKKLAYKSGIVWWWFCSDQSIHQAISQNKKSLRPYQQPFGQQQLQRNIADAQKDK